MPQNGQGRTEWTEPLVLHPKCLVCSIQDVLRSIYGKARLQLLTRAEPTNMCGIHVGSHWECRKDFQDSVHDILSFALQIRNRKHRLQQQSSSQALSLLDFQTIQDTHVRSTSTSIAGNIHVRLDGPSICCH